MGVTKLNNKDLFRVFGVKIERGGVDDFLAFPKRKESLTNDWKEENGKEIDLLTPKFEARQFKLKCTLIAYGINREDRKKNFWLLYNALFTELSSSGVHELYLGTLEKNFKVFYVSQQAVSNIGIEEKRMLIKFDLVFEETDPTVNIPKVYLVDHNDRFLIA